MESLSGCLLSRRPTQKLMVHIKRENLATSMKRCVTSLEHRLFQLRSVRKVRMTYGESSKDAMRRSLYYLALCIPQKRRVSFMRKNTESWLLTHILWFRSWKLNLRMVHERNFWRLEIPGDHMSGLATGVIHLHCGQPSWKLNWILFRPMMGYSTCA